MNFRDELRWAIKIDGGGTWSCEHVDASGDPQPATLLNLQDAEDEWPEAEPDYKRFRLACPDCGTWWRVAPKWNIAVYYAAPLWRVKPFPVRQPSYRQPIRRDIHTIMEAVRQALPFCHITQEAAYLPGSQDDGIWYFSLPDVEKSLQIESSSGMCPFLVETDAESSPGARKFAVPEEISTLIIAYFTAA